MIGPDNETLHYFGNNYMMNEFKTLRELLEVAYAAGWNSSGEGYNSEYHNDTEEGLAETRRDAIDEILASASVVKTEQQPIGYAHKADVARLMDEIMHDGKYVSLKMDHWACWIEDTPYDHLAPIYAAPITQTAPQYPKRVSQFIDQFADGVFVWYDEAGLPGGATSHLLDAMRELERYISQLNAPQPEQSDLVDIVNLAEPLIDLLRSEKEIRGDGNPPGATIALCETVLGKIADLTSASLKFRAPPQDDRKAFEVAVCQHKVEGEGFVLDVSSFGTFKNVETRMLFEGWRLAQRHRPEQTEQQPIRLPERHPEVTGTWGDIGDAYSAGVNDTLDEVARLNAAPIAQTAPHVEQKPITVEAVAVTRIDEDGQLHLDWLLEGGIDALECAGQVLVVAHDPITDDEGYGEVYVTPKR